VAEHARRCFAEREAAGVFGFAAAPARAAKAVKEIVSYKEDDENRTQEIQSWSGKGRHTTTNRELVMLPSGAMVIDTPGIREIGRVGEEDPLLLRGESSHRYRK
jgi:hypothetical protein